MYTTKQQKRLNSISEYNTNPNVCLHCSVPILHDEVSNKPLAETKGKRFCNTTCAARWRSDNRNLTYTCELCSKEYTRWSHRHVPICKECANKNKLANQTMQDMNNRAYVSMHARKVMKEANIPKKCFICEYDFFVEVCHIKRKADFPADAPLTEVNSVDNLVYLCPNHHKEFDKGKLKL